MTNRQIEQHARSALKQLLRELPLEDWKIELSVASSAGEDPDVEAQVHLLPEYRSAKIRLEPARMSSTKVIRDALRHELLHLMTSEMQQFWDLAKKDIPVTVQDTHERVFTSLWETMLTRLERMWR